MPAVVFISTSLMYTPPPLCNRTHSLARSLTGDAWAKGQGRDSDNDLEDSNDPSGPLLGDER